MIHITSVQSTIICSYRVVYISQPSSHQQSHHTTHPPKVINNNTDGNNSLFLPHHPIKLLTIHTHTHTYHETVSEYVDFFLGLFTPEPYSKLPPCGSHKIYVFLMRPRGDFQSSCIVVAVDAQNMQLCLIKAIFAKQSRFFIGVRFAVLIAHDR